MSKRVAVVIPSLGAPSLVACLQALSRQTLRPEMIVVVLSGGSSPPLSDAEVTMIRTDRRLGFAAAVNRGLTEISADTPLIALLNDDAEPSSVWLETLVGAMERRDDLAAVQGTVINPEEPPTVDGRGLDLDGFGLPSQVERGAVPEDGGRKIENRLGVSATAALYRATALESVRLNNRTTFDETFDSYHEDTDLALRLFRLGLRSAWIPNAPCHHVGSASGGKRRWRHPWWILANRWRTLAGNLSLPALAAALPRLMRGDIRAVRTLARTNSRAIPVAAGVFAALPWIIARGWIRSTPGPRLRRLPVNFAARSKGSGPWR